MQQQYFHSQQPPPPTLLLCCAVTGCSDRAVVYCSCFPIAPIPRAEIVVATFTYTRCVLLMRCVSFCVNSKCPSACFTPYSTENFVKTRSKHAHQTGDFLMRGALFEIGSVQLITKSCSKLYQRTFHNRKHVFLENDDISIAMTFIHILRYGYQSLK